MEPFQLPSLKKSSSLEEDEIIKAEVPCSVTLQKVVWLFPSCFSREPQREARQESGKVLNQAGFILGMAQVSLKGCVCACMCKEDTDASGRKRWCQGKESKWFISPTRRRLGTAKSLTKCQSFQRFMLVSSSAILIWGEKKMIILAYFQMIPHGRV